MKTKMRKSLSLLLAAALTFMTISDGTAVQAAKKSKKVNVKVSSVKITNTGKKLRLQKGKRFKLETSIKVKPNKSKYKKLKFTSSNRKIVLVNSRGLLKGMRVGSAKITVASKTNLKKKATISVSVTKDVLVSGIKLNKTRITADEFNEEEIQLEVKKILPANAKNKEVEWSTSDEDVADVDDDGVVTTGSVGTAVITATAADKGGATATCKVIVTKNTEAPDDNDDNANTDLTITPTPPVPSEVITPTPAAGDTDMVSPSPDVTDNIVTPTPKPDDKETPSPNVPSKTPADNQVFGVSDPYVITISDENEAYATNNTKRVENGLDTDTYNKDTVYNTDGSVTYTSVGRYNSGICFYIDPDVKTSMDEHGQITYTAKKVDLTKYTKVRITVKDAFLETSLKMLTDGSTWWSREEKWEGTDNIAWGDRVIEYELDEGGSLTWEDLKEAEAIGLGWHDAVGETATIVSIELVGKRNAVESTEKPVPVESAMPTPDEGTPSPSEQPSKAPVVGNQVFGVSDPYRITISEENEAYATSVSKRMANGMSVKEASAYNQDPIFNADGSVTFTSTDFYNSGICFYIDPDVKTSTDENGQITYTAKKVDLTKYSKVRITVKDAYLETSLKMLTNGSNWWSNVEKWEGTDNIAWGDRVIEYELDEGGTLTWEDLKEAKAIGLGWYNAIGERGTIVSIELVGKREAFEAFKTAEDKAALQSLIAEQRALGAIVSEDLDDLDEYVWNAEGRLVEIDWNGKGLRGDISFSSFEALKILNCGCNKQLSDLDVSNNTMLESLNCNDNQLSVLDVSNNTMLKSLNCDGNQLSVLDVSNNTMLESLSCHDNQLSVLDVSNNTMLESLSCHDNQLSVLDASNNTMLEYLNCNDNQLSVLDVSNNTMLEYLSCDDNPLSALDVSNNIVLYWLSCNETQLSVLDVSNNTMLEYLGCNDNQLSVLDVSNKTMLKVLDCSRNQLSDLDVSNNTMLKSLYCDGNQLSVLDVSNNTMLKSLDCDGNQLSVLDVSNNTMLEYLWCNDNQLSVLDVSNNTMLENLSCHDNQLSVLDVSNNIVLQWLTCNKNQLSSLDLTDNTMLEYLHCDNTVTVIGYYNQ